MAGRRYHHGDLPTALLDAVDDLVRQAGAPAVSLRQAAARAGVSHAAPAHHFGDKAGLLTAYAVQGFVRLRQRLLAAKRRAAACGDPELLAIGLAYVAFAMEEPGRFSVMFRPEQLRAGDPSYREASDAAFGVLHEAVTAVRSDLSPGHPELLAAATGAWAMVHGFATLRLDGSLPEEVAAAPPVEAAEATLAAFAATLLRAGAAPDADGAPAGGGSPARPAARL